MTLTMNVLAHAGLLVVAGIVLHHREPETALESKTDQGSGK